MDVDEDADYENNLIHLECEPKKVTLQKLLGTVREQGFEAKVVAGGAATGSSPGPGGEK